MTKKSEVMVIARRDQNGPYGKENCYWRPARSKRERQTGLEELAPDEPLELPMTAEQKTQYSALKSTEEQGMFLRWNRIMWRAENYGKGCSH